VLWAQKIWTKLHISDSTIALNCWNFWQLTLYGTADRNSTIQQFREYPDSFKNCLFLRGKIFPAMFFLRSRWQSRLSPGSCLAVHCGLRLAQTNFSPGFTLWLEVRDAPALPNELRAAMVTWLPVAADVICAVSCLAAELLQDNAYWLLQRVVRSPLLTSSLALQANASWNRNRSTSRPSRQVLLGRARYAGS